MTLDEFFLRGGEMLLHRDHGPMTFRLILQPLVAIILAIRVGLRDAREGREPYAFYHVVTQPKRRRELLRLAWKDVGRVFIVAFILDVVYELIVYHWVYPGESLIVATVLAIIPYLLVRGPVTRIARRLRKPKKDSHDKPD